MTGRLKTPNSSYPLNLNCISHKNVEWVGYAVEDGKLGMLKAARVRFLTALA
jgi:hypothetical protein